jgi:hypothetical protein
MLLLHSYFYYLCKKVVMALQIAPTPSLSGKDSELFNQSLNKGLKKKIAKKELIAMQSLVKSV